MLGSKAMNPNFFYPSDLYSNYPQYAEPSAEPLLPWVDSDPWFHYLKAISPQPVLGPENPNCFYPSDLHDYPSNYPQYAEPSTDLLPWVDSDPLFHYFPTSIKVRILIAVVI